MAGACSHAPARTVETRPVATNPGRGGSHRSVRAEIAAFEAATAGPCPHRAHGLRRRSSIRLWPTSPAASRGLRRSTAARRLDLRRRVRVAPRIVLAYRRAGRAVCGDNDPNTACRPSRSRPITARSPRSFAPRSPTAPVVISIKPSPSRWACRAMRQANALIAQRPRQIRMHARRRFTPMLGADGLPRPNSTAGQAAHDAGRLRGVARASRAGAEVGPRSIQASRHRRDLAVNRIDAASRRREQNCHTRSREAFRYLRASRYGRLLPRTRPGGRGYAAAARASLCSTRTALSGTIVRVSRQEA